VSDLRKILVVDDDVFVRRPLEFILVQEGFQPISARDGGECLDRLERDPPDLIILDVTTPDRDGFELCKAIKEQERFARIPVVLLSTRAQECDRERGLNLGAADFLAKPYSPSELVRRVRRILSDS
jgi:DNA-binding response OmpR family regulator